MVAANRSFESQVLFGLLAVQNHFVTTDSFLAVLQEWLQKQSESIVDMFVRRGLLSVVEVNALSGLVGLHLLQHDNDALVTLQSFVGDCDASWLEEFRTRIEGNQPLTEIIRPVSNRSEQGTVGGRFKLTGLHAKGGLGQVSTAIDSELQRVVAVKEIQPQYAGDSNCRARFMLEAQVNGALEHPGIVPVYGSGSGAQGHPYYAMRFVRGKTLLEAIKDFHSKHDRQLSRSSADFRQLLSRFVDVCQALDYAHSKGVLHRDIKPANIMLGDYGETLLLDWGLAKLLDHAVLNIDEQQTVQDNAGKELDQDLTLAGCVIGTPSYMPPEQAMGNNQALTSASDIYSLGATLYHILTGQPAFTGSNTVDLLRRVQSGSFPHPCEIEKRVPRPLNSICLKAMHLHPESRYGSCQELAAEIDRWLADEPVQAHKHSISERASRWLRRNRAFALASMIVLLITAVGMAASTTYLRIANDQFQKGLYFALARLCQTALIRGDDGTIDKIMADGFAHISPELRGWEFDYINTTRNAEERRFRVSDVALTEARLSRYGDHLLAIVAGKRAEVWDLKQQKKIWEFTSKENLVAGDIIDPNKQPQIVLAEIQSPTGPSVILSWKKLDEPPLSLQAEGTVTSIALTSNGSLCAWTTKSTTGTSPLAELHLTDTATNSLVATTELALFAEVHCLQFNADGLRLAIGGSLLPKQDLTHFGNGLFALYDVQRQKIVRQEEGTYPVRSLAFMDQRDQLLVGYDWGLVEKWSLGGEDQATRPQIIWEHSSSVLSIAVEASCRWWATGGADRQIHTADGPSFRQITGHWSPVFDLQYSSDSQHLTSVGSSGYVRVWNVERGQNQRYLPLAADSTGNVDFDFAGKNDLITAERFSREGANTKGTILRRWDHNYKETQRTELLNRAVNVLRCSRQFPQMMVVDDEQLLTIHSTKADEFGKLLHSRPKVLAGAFWGTNQFLLAFSDGTCGVASSSTDDVTNFRNDDTPITQIVVAENGSCFLLATERSVELWDRQLHKQQEFIVPAPPVARCAISNNGNLIAVTCGGFDQSSNIGQLAVWDQAGKLRLELNGEVDLHGGVRGVAFTADASRVLVGSYEWTTQVVRIDDGEIIFDIHEPAGPVREVGLSPIDQTLVGITESRHVFVHEAKSAK